MYTDLKNKVVLVTGASAGIGRTTALAFAKQGARLAISDVQQQEGNALAKEITNMGKECIYINCDVGNTKQVEAMIERVVDHFGSLDIAYNNAGIEGEMSFLPDGSAENFDQVINVNVKGVWSCMKYQIPVMKSQGKGVIINCSSIAGIIGSPGLPVYVASKHGVVGLTKNAALESARDGVRINAICPAGVQTAMLDRIVANNPELKQQMNDMHPIGRVAQPEEIANAVLFLASDQSSFITGHELLVDGGYTAQ